MVTKHQDSDQHYQPFEGHFYGSGKQLTVLRTYRTTAENRRSVRHAVNQIAHNILELQQYSVGCQYHSTEGSSDCRNNVFMQVSMNVLNMALSIWFVFWLHMDITGVAVATLLSQLYGGILSVVLMYYYGDFDYKALPWSELLDWREFIAMLQVNVNLMIRTACLLR